MTIWERSYLSIAGGLLILIGLIMLVTPGPGIIVIAAGLALWAKEYKWARRLLRQIRASLRRRLHR